MTLRQGTGSPRRRTTIQGVRACAVGLVVVHHFMPDWLPGGYVGVDIFFVVSGYLVLGRVLRTMLDGSAVRWGRFFYDRAKRIVPAAAVTVTVTLCAYALILNPLSADRYARDALASLAFLANFRMRVEPGGYFAVFDPSPFRHFWTLAVEEQFYLALPVAAVVLAPVAARWGRPGVVWLLGGCAAVAFPAAVLMAVTHPSAAFFLLPTRAWEFVVGGVAALLPIVRARWATGVGVAGIAVSTAMLSPDSVVPGPALVPAVVGTALILASSDDDVVSQTLGTRSFCWLGDRSYAVYLTHWPVAAWLFLSTGGEGASLSRHVVGLVGAVVAGHILHGLVESPLHHGFVARSGPRAVMPVTGALVVGSLVAAVVAPRMVPLTTDEVIPPLSAAEVLDGPLPQAEVVAANVEPDLGQARMLNALYDGCHEQLGSTVPEPCTFGGSWREVDLVVMGDSHAAHWFDAVQGAVSPGATTAFLTHTSCPLFPAGAAEPDSCAQWRASALELVRGASPQVVLLSNYTAGYGATAEAVRAGWEQALAQLGTTEIIVLGDVPTPPMDIARCLARHVEDARRCAFSPDGHQRRLNKAEQEAVERSGGRWVDTWDWLCARRCTALAGNTMLWRDASGHLTPNGSALLAPRVRGALEGSDR